MNKYIDFSDEVRTALDEHRPIVAIETGGALDVKNRETQVNENFLNQTPNHFFEIITLL